MSISTRASARAATHVNMIKTRRGARQEMINSKPKFTKRAYTKNPNTMLWRSLRTEQPSLGKPAYAMPKATTIAKVLSVIDTTDIAVSMDGVLDDEADYQRYLLNPSPPITDSDLEGLVLASSDDEDEDEDITQQIHNIQHHLQISDDDLQQLPQQLPPHCYHPIAADFDAEYVDPGSDIGEYGLRAPRKNTPPPRRFPTKEEVFGVTDDDSYDSDYESPASPVVTRRLFRKNVTKDLMDVEMHAITFGYLVKCHKPRV